MAKAIVTTGGSTPQAPAARPRGLTTRRKITYILVLWFIIFITFASAAELILRFRGYKPWRPAKSFIAVSPGGRFFQAHPSLGYSHIPGIFTITLGDDYSFRVSHLPNTLRITEQSIGTSIKRHGDLWIFGCSFTHGWSINDEETYPWLLQQRFPEYTIANFGVSGYGTIHSLIQFQEALKVMSPKIAVLAYAHFHDERNTFLRIRRKYIVPWNTLGPLVQPYARLDREGKLQYLTAEAAYSEFPLMRRLALMHFIETKYNDFEEVLSQSQSVSKLLIIEMARLARKHNVRFVLAGIQASQRTRDVLAFAESNGIPVVDISVDLSIRANTNLPMNWHPSALANRQYADKLERFLRAEILPKSNRWQ